MTTQAAGTSSSVQEFSIRVPKNGRKKHHMMRFNSVLNVDFSKWAQVKMERENNMKEFKGPDDDQPKFGAGSEFGRDAKEEARRKKYGIITKKYRPEDQPWILRVGGKTGKKFKGIREGGVGENAAFYVFTHAPDGAIEAYPLQEWYNFQPIQRYKALSAEEAEQEFGRRNKAMNYFSLMLRKRLRNEEGEPDEAEDGKTKKTGAKKAKELKISDMDDWVDSEEDNDSDEEEMNEEAKEKKEKKKKKDQELAKKKKKRKAGSDDSAVEESDDGDEEGRELDYISDSSDSESDLEAKFDKEMKGVAEESALRKLLTSDEDEDEEDEEGKDKNKEDKDDDKDDKDDANDKDKDKAGAGAKKKKKKKKVVKKEVDMPGIKAEADSSNDSSPDSSDSEAIDNKLKLQTNSTPNSRSGSPIPGSGSQDSKRNLSTPNSGEPSSKRVRLDTPGSSLSGSGGGDTGITEEAVRRYLMRKPMTTTELLQKFRSRKTGLSSEQLVNVMTQILKRINPVKQTIKNKMYLSIKNF
ncbi:general transcription factor IIF subunit 1 isoform X2 [Nilaparvata lugens]|uniref:general transcription factor IIF subunit 1 isoform X2 n=1 Tax=Nilaparvata lugens TaxID=108931 RepID=UPI00193DFBA9|nr:general transcription factor IIF subunit 1 isoform X2 [Nilaparvata lugens]